MLNRAFRLGACLIMVSLVAAAQPVEPRTLAARNHFAEGMKLYNVGDYGEALREFKAGYLAKPDPVFLYNMGQCSRQLGEAEGAARQYRSYLRELPDARNRGEVEQFIAAAEEQIKRKAANTPPTSILPTKDAATMNGTTPPPPTVTVTAPPPPLVTVAKPDPIVTPPPAKSKTRTGLYAGLGVAAVVVVGSVVGVSASLTLPANAMAREGTLPNVVIP